ncbi:MAG: UvrD-helicase domain-containing protein [Saccharofermentans sp.]|nr:UvrD-helicase domain-containing protein [Saccharofermentans sp.]
MTDFNTEDGLDLFDELNSLYEEELENEQSADGADALLSGLNAEQKEAVMHLDGPLLILAGAGSGKTRVITYRIAYMMERFKVAPGSILAITFTNKAANEMKERISTLVGDRSQYIWCGTFHSIFARILRRHAEDIGYGKNFNILDSDDQLKIVKQVMESLEISEKTYKPRLFQYEITNAKNHMIGHKEYDALAGSDSFKTLAAEVYKGYDRRLLETNSMDFDDILINFVKLLRENEEIAEFYRNKFRYIMVDEYQDTNKPQYEAVMLLGKKHTNVCVVGDDDQSIYAFRGADVNMILNFEKDFPGCKVIKLEQNYRSTKTILDAANEVIANNKHRKSKALRTEGEDGGKIIVMNADNGNLEARWTADTIKRLVDKGRCSYKDCAVLYRVNALSRSIESALREKQIPFKVYGGMRFYDRKEIKDVISYLRLINDSHDDLALERIINVPRRGIGDTTIDRIRQLAEQDGVSMFEVCVNCQAYPDLSRSVGKLIEFAALIGQFRQKLAEDISFKDFVDYVETESGIIQEIIDQREKKGEMTDRVENLKELLSEASEFEKYHRASNDMERKSEDKDDVYLDDEITTADTLAGLLSIYLENAALYASGDEYDEGDDFVKLMTVHSAKGLEFGAVFMIGVEDGIFPGYKSISDMSALEEERRLMYVAITRAKRDLFIVLTRQRMLFGQTQCFPPSRFLKEINPEHLYKIGGAREVRTETSSRTVASPAREQARREISSALKSSFEKKPAAKEGLRADAFKVGMNVTHSRFGDGVILKVEPVAGDALVTVDFDGMKKNMLANSAGLKRRD